MAARVLALQACFIRERVFLQELLEFQRAFALADPGRLILVRVDNVPRHTAKLPLRQTQAAAVFTKLLVVLREQVVVEVLELVKVAALPS